MPCIFAVYLLLLVVRQEPHELSEHVWVVGEEHGHPLQHHFRRDGASGVSAQVLQELAVRIICKRV